MTIEPSAIWAGIGTALGILLTAIAFAIRQYALSRAETSGNDSRGKLAIENAQAEGIKTLNTIAAQSLDVQKDLRVVIVDNGKAFSDQASQIRGMLLMLDGYSKSLEASNKLLRDATSTIDDVSVQVNAVSRVTGTLRTDIESTLTGQIGPVVVAIHAIGGQLEALNTTLQSKDETTVRLMERLQFSFGALETTLLKMLEPIALRTLGEIHEKHAENGNVGSAGGSSVTE